MNTVIFQLYTIQEILVWESNEFTTYLSLCDINYNITYIAYIACSHQNGCMTIILQNKY